MQGRSEGMICRAETGKRGLKKQNIQSYAVQKQSVITYIYDVRNAQTRDEEFENLAFRK